MRTWFHSWLIEFLCDCRIVHLLATDIGTLYELNVNGTHYLYHLGVLCH